MNTTKLMNKNFSLVALCNALALLGNMTLSFALAYYVRDMTGSETMFGIALATPYLSLVIMAPISGIIADRIKKQKIMFWLDISVFASIVLYLVIEGIFTATLPIIFVKLLVINAAEGGYLTVTGSAVPLIVPTEKLALGNAIMGMVQALVGALGQALGAVLYGSFGLMPILIAFAVVYGVLAVLDLFIRVPYKKQASKANIAKTVKADMTQAFRFMVKDKPIFLRFAGIIFVFTGTVICLFLVGTPILITSVLQMDLGLVGISQIFMGMGALGGGIVAGVLGSKLTIQKAPLLLMIISVLPLPIGLAILFGIPTFAVFVIITAASALIMFVNTLFAITAMTFLQQETPMEVLGKVMSLISILPLLAQAIGQFVFGMLFDIFATSTWIVIFIAVGLSVMATIYSHTLLKKGKMHSMRGGNMGENAKAVVLQ